MLVSSARGALEEGPYTASLRLGTAAEELARLSADIPGDVDPERRAFLASLAESQRAARTSSYFAGPEAYVAFLDEEVRQAAREVRRENGLDAR
jgi:predicted component of type VI protein secretion system